MKLLFDQNLSHKLVGSLADLFPGSAHVRELGLARAEDAEIWAMAGDLGFAIVSKDDDFNQRALLLGQPPKVVFLQSGNCSTGDIAATLRVACAELQAFAKDPDQSLLVISPGGTTLRS